MTEAIHFKGHATLEAAESERPQDAAPVGRLAQRDGGIALAVIADLAIPESRAAIVPAVESELEPIDVLVNNAAITWFQRVEAFRNDHWRTMFEVQVRAPFELAQQVLPGMRERGAGWILNISSVAAVHTKGPPFRAALPGGAVYGMCKAALERFTTALAAEVYEDGITVNALSPTGLVATPGAVQHKLDRIVPKKHHEPMANGPLHKPKLPGVPGLESFGGPQLSHQPLGLLLHRRRPRGWSRRTGRRTRGHHRHGCHGRPVYPAPGGVGPTPLRLPAHAILGRRAQQPPHGSGVGAKSRAGLAEAPRGELQHRRCGYDPIGRGGQSLSAKWADGVRTLHGMFLHEFPNCFLVNSTQSAFTVNFPHAMDEQCWHLADVVGHVLEEGVQRVEATKQAADDSVETIVGHARRGGGLLQECTPGYDNNEGQPGGLGGQRGFYGGGPVKFFELLSNWRTEESLRCLDLR